jgi:hypothetical protein
MAILSVESKEKFARGRGVGRVIVVVAACFFVVAGDLTSLGGMASLSSSLTMPLLLISLSSSSLLPSAVPSSPFSEEQGVGYVRQPGHKNETKNAQLTSFALPCTTVFGLEVESGCKIAKVAVKILDVLMVKLCLLDVLGIYVGLVVIPRGTVCPKSCRILRST